MFEAARTTASTGATWAIVIVSVSVLAFWLVAIYLADRSQVRASGRARPETWPAYAGPWARGGMAADQAARIPEQASRDPAGAPGRHARDESAAEDETPTLADIPAQPAAGSEQTGAAPGRHAMPAQRTGDDDRAERSRAGQGTPEQEDPGR
jgi:hypothetical protein